MATFFGEVTELSSRADWFSDSDDDEADNDKTLKVNYQTDVVNQKLLDGLGSQCKLLYVSVCKKTPQMGNETCILRLNVDKDENKRKGNLKYVIVCWLSYWQVYIIFIGPIASLYQLNASDYWLVVDNKLALEFSTFSSRLVDYIAENIFHQVKPKFDLFLVSNDMTRLEYAQYFIGNFNSSQRLTQLEKAVDIRPVISPDTVKSDFELALLEYCITMKQNFACFLLPMDMVETFIPKQITESVNSFSELSYSVIIT